MIYESFYHLQISHQVPKLAMPRIGCGLDGLNWPKVKEIICQVFQADSVELVVYNYVAMK